MYGFDPGAMQTENSPDEILKRLAQMLKDVGFGPHAALQRLLAGGMAVEPTGSPRGGSMGGIGGGGSTGGSGGGSGGGGGGFGGGSGTLQTSNP